jgi:hypothetical protein
VWIVENFLIAGHKFYIAAVGDRNFGFRLWLMERPRSESCSGVWSHQSRAYLAKSFDLALLNQDMKSSRKVAKTQRNKE